MDSSERWLKYKERLLRAPTESDNLKALVKLTLMGVKTMNYTDQYDKAVKEGTTKKEVAVIYKFESEGETLIGKLLDTNTIHFDETDSDVKVYIFDTDEGLKQCVLGSAMDKQFHDKAEIGTIYAVTFVEKKEIKGGKSVNIFNIINAGKAEPNVKSKVRKDADKG